MWTSDDQKAHLEGLSAGLERDIQGTLDPSFAIEWLLERGRWMYRCFDSECWFADASSMHPPASEQERQAEIEHIVFNVAFNMWPDEWTEPWPLCPRHADHPLNPAMKHERVCWVCDRDDRVSVPVGELSRLE
jgi:hypothetical protein